MSRDIIIGDSSDVANNTGESHKYVFASNMRVAGYCDSDICALDTAQLRKGLAIVTFTLPGRSSSIC